MALYDKLALTASRLLAKYGTTVILRQLSQGSADYDPNSGGAVPDGMDGTTDTNRKALVLDQPGSQISQRFGSNNQANTLISQGEKWLYIDTKGAAPTLQDKLIVKNIEYTIIDVQEMGPGGIAILYMVVVRV
jgi:hypothetical protein